MTRNPDTDGTNPPVSFDDTATAFRDKSDADLFLSYFIFSLTKNSFLVKYLSRAAKFCMAAGLPVKPFIKATVFKQFCGGETKAEYSRVIQKLGRAGIGAILDYSAEGAEDEASFETTKNELIKIIRTSRSNPHIPCTCMKMTGIASFDLLEKKTAGRPFSAEDDAAWGRVQDRLHQICGQAQKAGKPIYIDAEETWIQDAIDLLAEDMMKTYNRDTAVVFTTLQLYRTDRLDHFRRLIRDAESGSYKLGVKFVRGAYLEQERERAAKKGYPSPVNNTKKETDDEYDNAVRLFVEHIQNVELCLGTHNEKSCRLLVDLMAGKKIPNNHPHIYFSQLFGMSDNISYNLAAAGYNVSKYLPFGPVASTLPYLARRAEENTAIAGQMGKELQIIIKERNRRRMARRLERRKRG